jgi:hypothetical protein
MGQRKMGAMLDMAANPTYRSASFRKAAKQQRSVAPAGYARFGHVLNHLAMR